MAFNVKSLILEVKDDVLKMISEKLDSSSFLSSAIKLLKIVANSVAVSEQSSIIDNTYSGDAFKFPACTGDTNSCLVSNTLFTLFSKKISIRFLNFSTLASKI